MSRQPHEERLADAERMLAVLTTPGVAPSELHLFIDGGWSELARMAGWLFRGGKPDGWAARRAVSMLARHWYVTPDVHQGGALTWTHYPGSPPTLSIVRSPWLLEDDAAYRASVLGTIYAARRGARDG
jgi:hypothetical protein